MLSIRLLGPMNITLDGQEVALPTRKGEMILAYLALHATKPVARERLATYLWPESENALGNLRAELVRLRRGIGDMDRDEPLLNIGRQIIVLDPTQAEIDICQIDQLLAQCATHRHSATAGCDFCAEKLAQAVDLYRAGLLPDMLLPDSEELMDDLQIWQSTYENRILAALETLQTHLSQLGRHAQVIHYAQRQLALRPGLEFPSRQLMVAYTLSGKRQAALATYEELRDYLIQELGQDPSPRLTQLYEQIRSHRMEAGTPPPLTSPYPGLAAFSPANARYFYGHESTIHQLTEAVAHQPLVLLAGPSGSGKSSLVFAGLLPGLSRPTSEQATDWSLLCFRPGRDPVGNLAQALCRGSQAEEAAEKLNRALTLGESSLGRVVADVLATEDCGPEVDQARILLVVDQFEEIFTLCSDERVRRFFLTGFFDTLAEETSNLSVLIVLRADFLGQALTYHSFSTLPPQNIHFLGRMNNAQLQRAIEEPARQHGIVYEPGLIERILADLDDSPGQLPLLQFTLALLWDERRDQWITNAAYNEIEQVRGAITHYADSIYARLEPADQLRVRRIFLQLVHPGENIEDTRRLASRSEIGEEQWPLVHRLADARLVVTNQDAGGQETVEVIHEALIQEWSRLRMWLDDDRIFHLWQDRTRVALETWLRGARDGDLLLRGPVLAEAERWFRERGDDLDSALLDFIQASIQAREAQEAQERQRRQQLEAALAESRRMEQRALARQLGAQADQQMKRSYDLALLLGIEALARSERAQDRTDLLTSLEINPFLQKILHAHQGSVFYLSLGQDGKSLISSDERNNILIWQLDSFTHKRLLPQESAGADDVALDPTGAWIATVHGRQVALWATTSLQARLFDPGQHTDIFRLRFSVDGRYLLAIDTEGGLCLWEARTGHKSLPAPPVPRQTSLQVGPNAEMLAVAQGEGKLLGVRLIQRETGALLTPPLLGHQEQIHGLALNSDGSRLATASFDGSVRVWDTATGKESIPVLTAHTGRALFATFSPDGRWLATGGTDNLLLLWDMQSGKRLDIPAFRHSNWVRCAVFSTDGKTLFSGDSDGKIYQWDLTIVQPLEGHTHRVRTVAVSPNGKVLATASFDGTVGLWDTATQEQMRRLATLAGRQVMAGIFSPDGRIFAAVDNQGELLLWETDSWQRRAVEGNPHNEPSIALAFSPDSRLLAQGDLNGYVSLWDATTGELIHPPKRLHAGLASWVLTITFSPDGRVLTTGSKDRSIAFWSLDSLAPVAPAIEAHTNWVTDLLYSADGRTLISTSSDGTVRFWNPQTGEESAPPLTGHEGQVWQAEFSPVEGEGVLITLGGNGSVIWWDLKSRTPVAPPLRTHIETESMALSPDGEWLYLASFDGTGHRWKVPHGSWVERSRQIANRSLTAEERRIYLDRLN